MFDCRPVYALRVPHDAICALGQRDRVIHARVLFQLRRSALPDFEGRRGRRHCGAQSQSERERAQCPKGRLQMFVVHFLFLLLIINKSVAGVAEAGANDSPSRVNRPPSRVSHPPGWVNRPPSRVNRSDSRVSRSDSRVSRSDSRVSRSDSRVSRSDGYPMLERARRQTSPPPPFCEANSNPVRGTQPCSTHSGPSNVASGAMRRRIVRVWRVISPFASDSTMISGSWPTG